MSDTGEPLAAAKIVGGRAPISARRRALAVVPAIGAIVAIVLLWRGGLGVPRSPGWGLAGMAMVALILVGAAVAMAALLGRGKLRLLIAIAVALAIAPSVAWLRQRFHDDAAWAAVRAADRPKIVEQYLRWGERHRAEALAMRARHVNLASEKVATERAARVADVRARIATIADAPVREFLDAALDPEPQTTVAVVVTEGTHDVGLEQTIERSEVVSEVGEALHTVWPAGTVSLDYEGPQPMTVDVAYAVRPWIEDGVPVVYGSGPFVELGIDPERTWPAIEIALELHLRRAGAADVVRTTAARPPRELSVTSVMPLIYAYRDAAVSHAMERELTHAISDAIVTLLGAASPP